MNVPLATFLRARFARLAPCCVASTVIVVGVMWAMGDRIDPADAVRTLLVFPLLGTPSQADPLMWSLAVEWCLYLMFPLLLAVLPWLLRRRLLALAACEAGFVALTLMELSQHGSFQTGPLAVLRGLFPFVAGMLIYGGWNEIRCAGHQSQELHRAIDGDEQNGGECRVRRQVCRYAPWRRRGFLHDRSSRHVQRWRQMGGCMTRFLDSRPIRWLGEISLPLYLCQIVPLRMLGQSLWAIPATIGLAAVMHYAIEVPGRRWLRAGTKKPARSNHAPAGFVKAAAVDC